VKEYIESYQGNSSVYKEFQTTYVITKPGSGENNIKKNSGNL